MYVDYVTWQTFDGIAVCAERHSIQTDEVLTQRQLSLKSLQEKIQYRQLRLRETINKQSSLFPLRPVIKCFVIPPNSKIQQISAVMAKKSSALDVAGHKFAAVSRRTI